MLRMWELLGVAGEQGHLTLGLGAMSSNVGSAGYAPQCPSPEPSLANHGRPCLGFPWNFLLEILNSGR